jgi:preprotein translocase subunit SecE
MNKVGDFIKGVKGFFTGVRGELKKCSWPTRSELIDSTIVVIVSVMVFGIFVGISDGVIMKSLAVLIKFVK